MASNQKVYPIAVNWTITINKGQKAAQVRKILHVIQMTIFDFIMNKVKGAYIDATFTLTRSESGTYNLQVSGAAASNSTPVPIIKGPGPKFPKKDILKKGPFSVIEIPISNPQKG